MDIQSDRSDSKRRKEPKENNEEAKKKTTKRTPRKKRNTIQLPISNLIQLYSVVIDTKKQNVDITFGQLFQAVPKLRSELTRSLRTPQTRRVTAGIIVSKGLLDKLGVKIPRKSSIVIIN
ncbi:9066_t:CDS:2, partial [Entrophospora sp. SA101]